MPRSPLDYPPKGWKVAKEKWRHWWLWEEDHDGMLGPFPSRHKAAEEAWIINAERFIGGTMTLANGQKVRKKGTR